LAASLRPVACGRIGGVAPPPAAIGSSDSSDDQVRCPVCDFEYCHPIRLRCISPGRRHGEVIIDAHGLTVNPHCGPIDRGVWIGIEFACEDGHAFVRSFHFHKGSTFARDMVLGERPNDWATIWRD